MCVNIMFEYKEYSIIKLINNNINKIKHLFKKNNTTYIFFNYLFNFNDLEKN